LLVLLPIIGLAAYFSGAVQNVEWYHYRPTAWVMQDLDAASAGTQDKAWTELQRRLAGNSLSTAQQDALVDRSLREQQPGGAVVYRREMVDFLSQRYLDHKLSDARTGRFFDNLMKMRLDVRSVVGAGDRVPFRLAAIGRGPSSGWMLHVHELGRWVDGRRIEHVAMENGTWGFGSAMTSTLDPQPPGKHTMRVAIEVGALRGDPTRGKGTLDRTSTVQLTADFQVTTEKPELTWLTSPGAPVIQQCLAANDFLYYPAPSRMFQGNIRVSNTPMDLAFEVFARANGKEYPIGTVSYHRSAGGISDWGYLMQSQSLPGDLRTVDVILRSSEAVAKQTVDLTGVWQGEIIIPNVPVRRLQ
jgi:hypothetical protein